MRVVGVTGTIGSGKSAVLGLLAARGARTVDADALVHQLYESDADLQRRLSERFGPDVLSAGRVDRAALRGPSPRRRPWPAWRPSSTPPCRGPGTPS